MAIDRRKLLAGAGVLALGAPALLNRAAAQPAAPAPPAPPPAPEVARRRRIGEAAAANRQRLDYDGSRFSGAAWETLVAHGREAMFFLLGEEHGIAENPKLAAQLFAALAPSGYSKVAIEISPPMAAELDRALSAGGPAALNRMLTAPASRVAFYGMREEAEWLAAARRASPRGRLLWGTDYEVGADRHLIARLRGKRMPAAAAAALGRLEAASTQSWARFDATRGPEHIYSFAGDPELVRAVRAAWPRADAEAAWMLETLEETFAINRLWVAGRAWESNARRSAFMRANLLRHWRAEKAVGRSPRVFFKFGASHVVRGRNHSEVFDMGSLAPEIAALEGGTAYHLLVLAGVGRQVAALDPTQFRYRPVPVQGSYFTGLEPILEQAFGDAMTLFDMRPLRPLLGPSRAPAGPDLMRAVHGFDAILVMTGSTPSSNLGG